MKENIYQRKDGRYEGRLKIGYDENGKAKYKSYYGLTKTEVRTKLKEARKELIALSKDVKFETAAIKWLETKSGSKTTTYLVYKSQVESQLIPRLKDYTISQIDTKVKQEFIEALRAEGLAENTIRSYIQRLNLIIGLYKKEEEKLEYSNTDKNVKVKVEIMTDDEWENLKETLTTYASRTQLGVAIITYTGMKVGEVCGLKWEDIDLQTKHITIQRSVERIKSSRGEKTATRIAIMEVEERVIPIPIPLYEILKELKKRKGFVISDSDEVTEPRTFQHRLKMYSEEFGSSLKPMKIRNTFAVKALEAGVNVKALALILGVNVDMILKYVDCIDVDVDNEILKIK